MSNTSGIGLDGMGVDGSGVDKQNTGVGDSTEGVVVDTVETVKVLTENTEIATFIENSDTLGKNELNKLEETTSNTKKFFEELSPLIANIKELAKHLGITIMGLEEDKKENEKKTFYNGMQNKAKQLVVKAGYIKLIGPFIHKALVSSSTNIKKSPLESIGIDEIGKIEDSYKEVLNSFMPIYEKLKTEYNSLNEELKTNKSELEKCIQFLKLNNLKQEEKEKLEYIKAVLEDRIKDIENIIRGHENNVKIYQVYAVFLQQTFPKEFSKMQNSIKLKQASNVSNDLGDVLTGIEEASDKATKSAFDAIAESSGNLVKIVKGTNERKERLENSISDSMQGTDKHLVELSSLLDKKPTLSNPKKLLDK